MIAKIVAVVGLAIIASADARARSPTGIMTAQGVTDITRWYERGSLHPSYDCTGKADGNYPHPEKCTHYIACVAQSLAYEMVCATNHTGTPLHYVQDSGPDPAQSYCDYPEAAGCDGSGGSQDSTTAAPSNPDECDPDNCKEEGDCWGYKTCENGKWVDRECGKELWWNPNVNTIHGGVCDTWDNLDASLKEKYENDCGLPPCDWWQTGNQTCTGNYMYREKFEGKRDDREQELSCPSGLVWLGKPALTCGNCNEAVGPNNGTCC